MGRQDFESLALLLAGFVSLWLCGDGWQVAVVWLPFLACTTIGPMMVMIMMISDGDDDDDDGECGCLVMAFWVVMCDACGGGGGWY